MTKIGEIYFLHLCGQSAQPQPHPPLFRVRITERSASVTAAASIAQIITVAIIFTASYALSPPLTLSVLLSLYGRSSRYIKPITTSIAATVPTPKPPPVKSVPS